MLCWPGPSLGSPLIWGYVGGAQTCSLPALRGLRPPAVLKREAPPASSGEADVSQIKTPATSPCKALAEVQLPASPCDHEEGEVQRWQVTCLA